MDSDHEKSKKRDFKHEIEETEEEFSTLERDNLEILSQDDSREAMVDEWEDNLFPSYCDYDE